MRPTRGRTLVVVALASGAISWMALRLWITHTSGSPRVAWPVSPALALFAVGLAVLAFDVWRRLRGRPPSRPLDPLFAAKCVALAKACALAGSLLVGLYAGFTLALVPEREVIPISRLVSAGLSSLAAAAVVGAGLLLEWVCRVRPSKGGEPGLSSH